MSHLRWIRVIFFFFFCAALPDIWIVWNQDGRSGGLIWSQFELFNKKSQMKPPKGTPDRGFDWKPSDYPQDISPLCSFFQLLWLRLFSCRLLLRGRDTNSKYYICSNQTARSSIIFFFSPPPPPLGIRKVAWQLNCEKGCANSGSCQTAVIFAMRRHSSDKHWWNIKRQWTQPSAILMMLAARATQLNRDAYTPSAFFFRTRSPPEERSSVLRRALRERFIGPIRLPGRWRKMRGI